MDFIRARESTSVASIGVITFLVIKISVSPTFQREVEADERAFYIPEVKIGAPRLQPLAPCPSLRDAS